MMKEKRDAKMMANVMASTLLMIAATSAGLTHATEKTNKTAQKTSVTQAAERVSANRLNALLKNMHSMQAAFQQVTTTKEKTQGVKPNAPKRLQMRGMNKRFTGTMMVQRPNKFRWETKQPAEQLIVADNKTLWIYDPDLEQATQQQVDSQVANTPALLLSGSPQTIMNNFRVTQPNVAKDVFVLYPKNAEAVFETLAIAFVAGKPRSMVLNDALGQVTTITFTQIKKNPKLNAALFRFQPPEGVDVIYQ